MTGSKLATFSTLIGLIVMGILLAVFNDSPLYVKGIIGGGTSLLSWGFGLWFGKLFDHTKGKEGNDQTNYPVMLVFSFTA